MSMEFIENSRDGWQKKQIDPGASQLPTRLVPVPGPGREPSNQLRPRSKAVLFN
jgi:hypothetical protein